MTLHDIRCTTCGQEEGTFPSMREAVRVLAAQGWWCPQRLWYCPPCGQRQFARGSVEGYLEVERAYWRIRSGRG